ncbi:MAG TPA: hypothetical protein VGH28_02350 [Polyangiaceae bacterium]
MCSIESENAQTCDATFVLGDGTTHTAHLVVTEAVTREPESDCPATCRPSPEVAVTVDGSDAGPTTDFSSPTCVTSDAAAE